MNTPSVKSFRALRKLKIRVKPGENVEIAKAGGFVKARIRGHANFTFGATAEEAKQRLLSIVSKNLGIVPRPITNFEKQLLQACR